MAPLPLFKLGALLIKQIAKPLAKVLKEKAKQNEKFKQYFVIPAAGLYHNIDITVRMRLMGLGSPDKVPPLTEKAAIELGGDLLSEFFVFGTAALLIVVEYLRQSSNKTSKDTAVSQNLQTLENNVKELLKKDEEFSKRFAEMNKFMMDQKAKIDELNAKLTKINSKVNVRNATQGTQTTNGRQIGKVINASNAPKKPSDSLTDSILYQTVEKTANDLKTKIVGK